MDIKAIIEKVLPYAPNVATALGSPLAGMAMSLLNGVLGIKPEEALKNINNDPILQLKLKQIDADLEKYRANIAATETQNARQFEIEDKKMGKSHIMPIIITIYLMAMFSVILYLSFFPVANHPTNSTIIGALVGLIVREFMQVCRFYLGGDDKSN